MVISHVYSRQTAFASLFRETKFTQRALYYVLFARILDTGSRRYIVAMVKVIKVILEVLRPDVPKVEYTQPTTGTMISIYCGWVS